MGLLNFIKKNKQNNILVSMPSAMLPSLAVLFTNYVANYYCQLDDSVLYP